MDNNCVKYYPDPTDLSYGPEPILGMCNIKALSLLFKTYGPVEVFSNIGHKSRSHSQNLW